MPNQPPPEAYDGEPKRGVLAAGTRLTRIHSIHFGPTAFNPTLADRHWGGGRFDATEEDPHAFLYAALDDLCAVAEALLRDLPLSTTGSQLLPRASLADRQSSWMAPRRDLELLSLRSGRDLAAIGQDSWLTKCESADYAFTRRWGHTLRRWAPWAQGLVWRSRREEASLAYIFFGDRCPDAFTEVPHPVFSGPDHQRLDQGPAAAYVRALLAEYNVTLYR